jgi:hypothetical protein
MDTTPPPVPQEMEKLEYQILHNDFPPLRALPIEKLLFTLGSLKNLQSSRYYPDREIGADTDIALDKQIATIVRSSWERIKFKDSLTPVQQHLLMELMSQYDATLENNWLLTPKGKIRIEFDPAWIKKLPDA